MDSWRGVYITDEFEFEYDNHGINKSKLEGCEFKPLLNVESYPLERLDFMEMGFSSEIKKSYSISSDPSGEVFSDEIGTSYGNVGSSLLGEEKNCGFKIISTDSMLSNNKESSIVDLNLGILGRLVDGGVGREVELTEDDVSVSFVASSPRVKRSRSTSFYMQSSRCQVLGCNKDLGSYKGYYKRHKVCKEHTRTACVTVNGMDQRFCQQCSRFHQVAEFDDDKRSCRKRLAVHNNRRRKPRLPSDDPGTGIINFSSSHVFSKVFPTTATTITTPDPSKLKDWKWAEHTKVEDPADNWGTFFHISGISENTKDIPVDVKGNITSTSTSTLLNSSIVRQSSRALSLLSAQSHTALTSPSINQSSTTNSNLGSALHYSQDVFKEMVKKGLHENDTCLMEADNVDHTIIVRSESNTIDPHLPGDSISRESDLGNAPVGHGIILDLSQLSSRLQTIEQQKLSTESEAG